jgi:hypothetical protein
MSTVKVYNSSTGQWEYAAIGAQGPQGPAGTVAVEVGGPITLSGTSTAATLGFNSTGYVRNSFDNVLSSVTQSTSYQTGALVISGGVGIAKNLYVQGNIDLTGNININGTITGNLTEVNVTNLNVVDSLIYLADNNLTSDSVDIGIYGAYRPSTDTSGHKHTGLIRDHNDSGIWKLVSGAPEVDSNDVDFGLNDVNVNFDQLKLKSLIVTDASTTRTNLGLGSTSAVSFGTITAGGVITTTIANNRGAINISSSGTGDPSATLGGDFWSVGTSARSFKVNSGSAGIKTLAYADGSNISGIPNSATTATNANTASAIVVRDASGNFSAGTITATGFSGPLSGNATTATGLTGTQPSNVVYAGPASGSATTATFRALVIADLPSALLSNSISGVLKATAGVISAATANTDYLTPSGSGTSLTGVVKTGSANTFSAKNTFAQGSATEGSINIPSMGPIGPSAPLSGDLWVSGTSGYALYFRSPSITYQLAYTDGSNADTSGSLVLKNNANAFTVGGHTITNSDPAVKPLMIKAANSQSANLLEIQPNASTTPIFQVTSFGGVIAPYVSAANNGLASTRLYVNTSATEFGIVARGSASQTADLFQFQSSTPTVLAGTNAVGQSYTGSTTPILTQVGGVPTGTNYGVSGGLGSPTATTFQITLTSAHNLAVGDLVTVTGLTYSGSTNPNGTFVLTGVGNAGPYYVQYTLATNPTIISFASGAVTAPAQSSITQKSAVTIGLTIKPFSSTSTYTQTWQSATSSLVSSVQANGSFAIGTFGGNFGSQYSLSIGSITGATGIPVAIRGSTNQAGDLLQLHQSASPYILAGINAAGQFYTGPTTAAPINGSSVGTISATTVTANTSTVYQLAAATGLTVGDLITVPSAGALTSAQGAGTNLVVTVVDDTNFRVTALTPNATASATGLSGTMTVPAQVSITSRNSSTTSLAINIPASSTGNFVNFLNGTTSMARIDSAGGIRTPSVANTTLYANSSLSFSATGLLALTGTSGNVPLKIQNSVTSSTSDLTQWIAGSTTVARVDVSGGWGGTYTNTPSHRNVLHNGGFNIWQRGTSVSITNSTAAYGCDRWIGYANAQSTMAGVLGGTGTSHYVGATLTPFAGVNITGYMVQRIEAKDSWHLAGNTVTVSGNFTGTAVVVALYYATTSDDSWSTFTSASPASSGTVITSSGGTVTSNGTRSSISFPVPAAAVFGLQLVISTATIDSIPLKVQDVQLELGSVATPFERRPYNYELALCQRYYERVTNTSGATSVLIFTVSSSSAQTGLIQHSPKRVLPTFNYSGTWYGGGTGLSANVNTVTGMTYTAISLQTTRVQMSVGGTTNGNGSGLAAAPNGYYELIADL